MEHTVTDQEATNEPSSYEYPHLGNQLFDFDFRNFIDFAYKIPIPQKSNLLLQKGKIIFKNLNTDIQIVNKILMKNLKKS